MSNAREKKGTGLPKYLMIGGAIVALPSIALSFLGFGTAGIAAGSVAATSQAAVGNVAAGSAFSIAQCLGATGVFFKGMLVGGASAGVGAGVKGWRFLTNNKKGLTDNNKKGLTDNNKKACPTTTKKGWFSWFW